MHKHKKSEHVLFFLCLCYAYVTLVSSENEDEISTSISTRLCDRLVLMIDIALAHLFMLMFWRPHLLSADYAHAHACAYALLKTSLKGFCLEQLYCYVSACIT